MYEVIIVKFDNNAWKYFNSTGNIEGYLTYKVLKDLYEEELSEEFYGEKIEIDTKINGDSYKRNKNK